MKVGVSSAVKLGPSVDTQGDLEQVRGIVRSMAAAPGGRGA